MRLRDPNVNPAVLEELRALIGPFELPPLVWSQREDIPPFFNSYLEDVPLPSELVNEPFTLDDTGDRPELKVRRPKFQFIIDEIGVPACLFVGHAIRTIGKVRSLPPNMKVTSAVSVLTVYDTYGLAVACTYLRYLYQTKYLDMAPDWLLVYLIGSLYAIDPTSDFGLSDTSSYYVLYICCQIMRSLENLDKNEPKMLGELGDVPEGTLPSNLLARIISSERVSHRIASEVRSMACNSVPSNEELKSAHGWMTSFDLVCKSIDKTNYFMATSDRKERRIVRSGRRYLYSYTTVLVPDVSGYKGIGFSVRQYLAAYLDRGCNPIQSISTMLDRIRRDTQTTEENVDTICTWLLVLSDHLDQNKHNMEFSNIFYISEELDRLLELTIASLS